jgi:hypothetical protein
MGPGPMSHGTSSDGCDGANKLLENVQSIVGWSATGDEGKTAAQLFQKALMGPNAAAGYYDNLRLPKIELCQANPSANSNVINMQRAAAQLARPGVAEINSHAPGANAAAVSPADRLAVGTPGDAATHIPADMAGKLDMQGLVHAATGMADPIGFLRAFFEMLNILCPAALGAELLQGAGQLVGGLPPMEIYNIGYQASLDMEKLMASGQ